MTLIAEMLLTAAAEKIGRVIGDKMADPGLAKIQRHFEELGWVTDGRVGDAVQLSLKTQYGPKVLNVRTKGQAAVYSTSTVPVPARNLTPAAVERALARNRGLAVGTWELHRPSFGPAGFVIRHTTALGPLDRGSHMEVCMALLEEAKAMDEALKQAGVL